MQRIVGLAGKVALPPLAGGATGGAPGMAGRGSSGGGPTSAAAAAETASQHWPARARAVVTGSRGGRSGRGGAINSGQFLTNFQSIIEPILPQLDQMMQQPGGGASAASQAIRQHLQHVQTIAAQPPGSQAESYAILQANQATGVDPYALARAAQSYRTEPASSRAVTQAYLSAQQHAAQNSATPSPSPAVGVVQQLAGAAGFGELGGLLGGGAAMAGIGAAALGVGYVATQTRQGFSTYLQQGTAVSALSKTLGDLGESFNTLRTTINATGLGFAESLATITAATQALAPYVGNVGTQGIRRYLTAAQSTAYGLGLNPVSTTQAFGQLGQVGILPTNSSTGQLTPNQFAALLANAVSAGSMQGRQGQVLSALVSLSQTLTQQLGQAPNANLLAGITNTLNRSGNPALQGTLGAQVLNSINQGIQAPGLGQAGAFAAYQQLNPNGKLGYFQEQYLQAQGINGVSPSGISNLSAVLQYYQKMLPGGRVAMRGGLPSEQTASVAALLGAQLGLSQPLALNVLKAFQGQSITQENATQALAAQLGPHALNTIIHKGGLTALAGIANATGLGGPEGLNAQARQITHALGGHVSAAYETLAHQYTALGREHPTSRKQAATIAHQRAEDLAQMKTVLGKSLVGGPTLGTSMDQLNTTMNKANAQWAKIGRELQPLVHVLSELNLDLANAIGSFFTAPGHAAAHGFVPSNAAGQRAQMTGRNTSYTIPGISGASSQAQAGATLASFVQGNQQSTLVSALVRALGGGTATASPPSGPPRYQTADYVVPSSATSALTAAQYAQEYLPIAKSSNVTRWNAMARQDMARLKHLNPHLSIPAIDTILATQSGGKPGVSYYNKQTGTTDYGLMQLDSGNFGQWHLNAQQALNPQQNLAVGIQFFNHLLNTYHGNVFSALEAYSGISPQGAQDAADMKALLQALVHHTQNVEKNTRPLKALPIRAIHS